jgi:UPF0271 protein
MSTTIDLNADVGEKPELLADGREEALLELVSSANIACGGHAGTRASMASVIEIALRHGVALGAHPGYPDPDHFGRVAMELPAAALEQSIAGQVAALAELAQARGASLRHVKPHGALYNLAAADAGLAAAIARALSPLRDELRLFGLAGSDMLEVWRRMGFRVAAEAFADRRYEADGTLRSRRHPDAVITDAAAAAEQALEIVLHRRVRTLAGTTVPVHADTLCVHGDTPDAIAIAGAIGRTLAHHGVAVRRPD